MKIVIVFIDYFSINNLINYKYWIIIRHIFSILYLYNIIIILLKMYLKKLHLGSCTCTKIKWTSENNKPSPCLVQSYAYIYIYKVVHLSKIYVNNNEI